MPVKNALMTKAMMMCLALAIPQDSAAIVLIRSAIRERPVWDFAKFPVIQASSRNIASKT
jgi:hypothetical protein